MELFGIEMTLQEYDALMVAQSQGKELVVNNGKVVARIHQPTEAELAEARIYELKQKLANTDYEAIKYAEGAMSAAEYAPYKADRAKWRAEINELEKKL